MGDETTTTPVGDERRQVLREFDREIHDAMLTMNANMANMHEMMLEERNERKQLVEKLDRTCEQVVTIKQQVHALESDHTCPFHADVIKNVSSLMTDRDTFKGQIGTLFKDRYAMLVMVILTLIGLVQLLAKEVFAK